MIADVFIWRKVIKNGYNKVNIILINCIFEVRINANK